MCIPICAIQITHEIDNTFFLQYIDEYTYSYSLKNSLI